MLWLWLLDQPRWVRHLIGAVVTGALGATILALWVRETGSGSLLVPLLLASIAASPPLGWGLYRFLRWSDSWEGEINTRWVVAVVVLSSAVVIRRSEWTDFAAGASAASLCAASCVAAALSAFSDSRRKDLSPDES